MITQIAPNYGVNFPYTKYVHRSRYGTGGACAAQGYDPPGGWLCADYGGMHGGTYTPGQGWSGGYPTPFPASVELSNTSGVQQAVFRKQTSNLQLQLPVVSSLS